eukprot:1159563-Lingulodinium_polyedra.AAC.1
MQQATCVCDGPCELIVCSLKCTSLLQPSCAEATRQHARSTSWQCSGEDQWKKVSATAKESLWSDLPGVELR